MGLERVCLEDKVRIYEKSWGQEAACPLKTEEVILIRRVGVHDEKLPAGLGKAPRR